MTGHTISLHHVIRQVRDGKPWHLEALWHWQCTCGAPDKLAQYGLQDLAITAAHDHLDATIPEDFVE